MRWIRVRRTGRSRRSRRRSRAPRASRDLELLEDHDAGAFAHHEAVAVLVERAAGLLRLVVARRERAHRREPADAHRRDRRFGSARDHDVGIVAADDLEGFADRVRRRGAGGAGREVRAACALKRIETWPAARLMMDAGMKNGEMRRGPPLISACARPRWSGSRRCPRR